jgi:large subunit ribosomal protein L32
MVIRMRHTKSHTANRRSHHALTTPSHVTDKATGSVHMRHRVDMKTGMYNGKKVLDVVSAVAKKQAK